MLIRILTVALATAALAATAHAQTSGTGSGSTTTSPSTTSPSTGAGTTGSTMGSGSSQQAAQPFDATKYTTKTECLSAAAKANASVTACDSLP